MDLVSIDGLKNLTSYNEPPCISIYMPTIRAGEEIRQNPTRFKNLVRQAEERLSELGIRSAAAKVLLDPAFEMIHDEIFWQNQSDGLALFLSDETTRYYRVPLNFDELVVVSNNFHIKQLVPLFSSNGRFYILALSQNEVRLLEGTRYSVDEVNLRDVPESLEEALKWDDPEEQLQHHASEGRSTGGEKVGMFHGHGVGTDDQKNNILRYFQQINTGLRKMLADENVPLVLAGVEYLLPIYQEANTYPHLIEDGITGNPEMINEKELHKQAWTLVEPLFQEQQVKAVDLFRELERTERASADLAEIVSAAYFSRVDQLFVTRGTELWGQFNPDTNQIEQHNEVLGDSVDLLDYAVVHTFLNGGQVYIVEPDELPSNFPLAAIFRWPG